MLEGRFVEFGGGRFVLGIQSLPLAEDPKRHQIAFELCLQRSVQLMKVEFMYMHFLREYGCIIISVEKRLIMSASARKSAPKPDPSTVLTKAVARAAERLDISRALLAKILGVSPPTVTRLYSGEYKLDERRKEWEFALLFVRAFRSLDSIVGNEQTARQWLNSENRALNGRPVDLIRQTEGLVRVVHYLDASRGLV